VEMRGRDDMKRWAAPAPAPVPQPPPAYRMTDSKVHEYEELPSPDSPKYVLLVDRREV